MYLDTATEAILTSFAAGIHAFRCGDFRALEEAFRAYTHLKYRYTVGHEEHKESLAKALDMMYRRIDEESFSGFTDNLPKKVGDGNILDHILELIEVYAAEKKTFSIASITNNLPYLYGEAHLAMKLLKHQRLIEYRNRTYHRIIEEESEKILRVGKFKLAEIDLAKAA